MVEPVPLISMQSVTDLVQAIQPQDWFTSVDLHEAYCHVLIAPEHWCISWSGFQWKSFQWCVLPFGLSAAPFMQSQTTHCEMSFGESTEALGQEELVHNWPDLQLHHCYYKGHCSAFNRQQQHVQMESMDDANIWHLLPLITVWHALWLPPGQGGLNMVSSLLGCGGVIHPQ